MKINFKHFSCRIFCLVVLGASLYVGLFFTSSDVKAQSEMEQSKQNKILATFLINFIKFTEFPKEVKTYNICVQGSSELADSLNTAAKFLLNDVDIKAYSINNIDAVQKCQVFYISKKSSNTTSDIDSYLKNSKAITVSDKHGFIKNNNGMIEVSVDNGKFFFKLNLAKIEKLKIKVSSKLVEIAEEVY